MISRGPVWVWVLLALMGCKSIDEGPPLEPEPGEPVVRFPAPPRNVLMISVDTLRRDHLGRYGGGPTPFLDRLLAESVVLDDFVQCANWTLPSVACTLTGRSPVSLGVWPRLTAAPQPLPDAGDLAGWLGGAGLYGILVSSNFWLSPIGGTTHGYAEVAHVGDVPLVEVWREAERRLDDALADGVDRWFLHLHLLEPHAPYDPPEAYLSGLADLDPAPWDLSQREEHYTAREGWPELSEAERALLEAHLRVRYQGEVQWLDDQLAAVWAELDARGWLDDALVVLWSDHGEQFWEHGRQSHAWQLHAEETDAIAAFWARDLPARAFSGPTHALDLVPTVLSALDLPLPGGLEGFPVGLAPEARLRFQEAHARSGVEQTVLGEGFKLRYHWSGRVQLFDRGDDPGEQRDLWDPEDKDARALWEAVWARARALRPMAGQQPHKPGGL